MSAVTLKEIGILEGHKDGITSLDVFDAGDSDVLYSSSRDKRVFQWKLKFGSEPLALLTKEYSKHGHHVNGVISSRSGGMIVSAGSDTMGRIFDATTKEMVLLSGHTRDVLSVAINSKDNMIVTGSVDGSVALWNTKGELAGKYGRGHPNAHADWVTCVAFIPAMEDLIVSGSADGTLKVWDIVKGEVLQTFKHGVLMEVKEEETVEKEAQRQPIASSSGVTSISITPDGTLCAYGGRDAVVYILNLKHGTMVRKFHTESAITSLAFGLTEPILACGTKTAIYLWDVVKDVLLYKISSSEYGRSVKCTSLAWARSYLISGLSDGKINVYDCVRLDTN
jgi:guanine nucleotide-binding protein subunit beta-2-like 1 protein